MRHYNDWKILTLALYAAMRPILIPAFAMALTVIILSGSVRGKWS